MKRYLSIAIFSILSMSSSSHGAISTLMDAFNGTIVTYNEGAGEGNFSEAIVAFMTKVDAAIQNNEKSLKVVWSASPTGNPVINLGSLTRNSETVFYMQYVQKSSHTATEKEKILKSINAYIEAKSSEATAIKATELNTKKEVNS